jgi:hypothetical protein
MVYSAVVIHVRCTLDCQVIFSLCTREKHEIGHLGLADQANNGVVHCTPDCAVMPSLSQHWLF